jgi:transcriptional repressor NrdR
MHCPYCDAEKDRLKVIDSRSCDSGKAIRRRRQCLTCNKRFTTYERSEKRVSITVVKRDGRREPWERDKIVAGLERACFKRPIPVGELIRIRDEVEEEVFQTPNREVSSAAIAKAVAGRLRSVDQVAYVRFASVIKQFKTLDELVEEAQAVIQAKRYEDPDQGKLFIEEKARQDAEKAAGEVEQD